MLDCSFLHSQCVLVPEKGLEMKDHDVYVVAIAAIVTALALKFCGEFAWNFIASFSAAVVMMALSKVGAEK